jgi:hypothetical protein
MFWIAHGQSWNIEKAGDWSNEGREQRSNLRPRLQAFTQDGALMPENTSSIEKARHTNLWEVKEERSLFLATIDIPVTSSAEDGNLPLCNLLYLKVTIPETLRPVVWCGFITNPE